MSQNLIITNQQVIGFDSLLAYPVIAYNSTQIAVTPVSIKGAFIQNIVSLTTSLGEQSSITYRNNKLELIFILLILILKI